MQVDPKKQAEIDQAVAGLIDTFPHTWRLLYLSLLTEGFSESQSLELVKTWILSQSPFGINGAK